MQWLWIEEEINCICNLNELQRIDLWFREFDTFANKHTKMQFADLSYKKRQREWKKGSEIIVGWKNHCLRTWNCYWQIQRRAKENQLEWDCFRKWHCDSMGNNQKKIKKNILGTCSQFLLIKKGIAKISPDQAAKHNKSPNSFAKEENYRR